MGDRKKKKGFAISSLILGIVALFTCFIGYIAIPCSIVGGVLGVISLFKRRGGRSGAIMALVGGGLCAIALVLSVIIVIAAFLFSQVTQTARAVEPGSITSFLGGIMDWLGGIVHSIFPNVNLPSINLPEINLPEINIPSEITIDENLINDVIMNQILQ